MNDECSDYDEDDIDWAVGSDDDGEFDGNHDQQAAIPRTQLIDDNFDEDEEASRLSKDKSSKTKKRPRSKRIRLTDDDLVVCQRRCQIELMNGFLHLVDFSQQCDDTLLQHCMVSLLPLDVLKLVEASSQPNQNCGHGRSLVDDATVRRLMGWFQSSFRCLGNKDVSREEGLYGSAATFLISNILPSKTGSQYQLLKLFTALLRALGVLTRVVCCLSPCSLHPKYHDDIISNRETNSEEKESLLLKKTCSSNNIIVDLSIDSGDDDNNNHNDRFLTHARQARAVVCICYWIEIAITDANQIQQESNEFEEIDSGNNDSSTGTRMNCIHLASQEVDNPRLLESLFRPTRKGCDSFYVLAMENNQQFSIDVTARYWSKYAVFLASSSLKTSDSRRKKIPSFSKYRAAVLSWWRELIVCFNALSNFYRTSTSTSQFPVIDQKSRIQEQQELLYLSNVYSDPKTFLEFKDHPLYILERDLKTNEMLNPQRKRMVKLFKGEGVYLQKDKEIIRSKSSWKKFLKLVRSGEEPVKTVRRTRASDNNAADERSREFAMIEVPLFGSWQTEPYIISPIVDDIIPVNEHGNIEVFDGCTALVPPGATLITAMNAAQAAKAMGIPFAPALFGFDRKGNGQSIPKIGGIVVLCKHASIVKNAADNIYVDKLEKSETKREIQILARWKALVRNLLLRQQLREQYGA